MSTTLYYSTMDAPTGPLTIIASEEDIIRADFGSLEEVKEKALAWFERYFGEVIFLPSEGQTEEAEKQLREYFVKERESFSLPFKLYGTNFQKSVWKSIEEKLAYRETCSYKEVGEQINNVKAVRAIGGALNKNPISIIIPCHRVIGSSGSLVGYGGGLDAKSYLLNLEYES